MTGVFIQRGHLDTDARRPGSRPAEAQECQTEETGTEQATDWNRALFCPICWGDGEDTECGRRSEVPLKEGGVGGQLPQKDQGACQEDGGADFQEQGSWRIPLANASSKRAGTKTGGDGA